MNGKTVTFEMNGIGYKTDEETLNVLRSIIPQAKMSNDFTAVSVVMTLGLQTGRIEQMA